MASFEDTYIGRPTRGRWPMFDLQMWDVGGENARGHERGIVEILIFHEVCIVFHFESIMSEDLLPDKFVALK